MSTDDGIERDIAKYLGAHYGIEVDQITDDANLEDLGVDSLGLLVAADIIENKYRISLDDERIAVVRTLRDLKNLVALKRAEKACRSTTLVPNTGTGGAR
jgi:acyl carrier protein